MSGLGVVQRRVRETISELGIAYHHSPIVAEDTHSVQFRQGPAPGDRAPDGPLQAPATGAETSLFAVLRDTRHTLLLFSGPTATDHARRRLREVGRLRCLRGVDTLTAVGLCAEIGDFERFARAG